MKYFVILTAVLSLGVQSLHAQGVPDNDKIFEATISSSSPYYYPSLMGRYMDGDTDLTLDDYHYLYYGFAYQDAYKPLEAVTGGDGILAIFEENPDPGPEEAMKILYFAKQVMDSDPFSPANINYLTYAYGIIGDTLNERINADRFAKVLATIESSGTGLTEKSPWHILWFSHGLDIVASRGLDIRERRVVSRSVEYVDLQRNDENVKGFYFDFSRIYWKRPENIPARTGKQGLTLNGIPIIKR